MVEEARPSTRSETLSQKRKARVASIFAGKRFKIIREVHLSEDERFQSPLGDKGRHGFVIENVADPTERHVVGRGLLRKISDEFMAVDLPPRRNRRTRAQVEAEQAASLQAVRFVQP